ncbi:unnamed protein product [Urochloa humidicola]
MRARSSRAFSCVSLPMNCHLRPAAATAAPGLRCSRPSRTTPATTLTLAAAALSHPADGADYPGAAETDGRTTRRRRGLGTRCCHCHWIQIMCCCDELEPWRSWALATSAR